MYNRSIDRLPKLSQLGALFCFFFISYQSHYFWGDDDDQSEAGDMWLESATLSSSCDTRITKIWFALSPDYHIQSTILCYYIYYVSSRQTFVPCTNKQSERTKAPPEKCLYLFFILLCTYIPCQEYRQSTFGILFLFRLMKNAGSPFKNRQMADLWTRRKDNVVREEAVGGVRAWGITRITHLLGKLLAWTTWNCWRGCHQFLCRRWCHPCNYNYRYVLQLQLELATS